MMMALNVQTMVNKEPALSLYQANMDCLHVAHIYLPLSH